MHIYNKIVETEYYQRKNRKQLEKKEEKKQKKKKKKSATPGIPRRSPIQVLTGLDVALLR